MGDFQFVNILVGSLFVEPETDASAFSLATKLLLWLSGWPTCCPAMFVWKTMIFPA